MDEKLEDRWQEAESDRVTKRFEEMKSETMVGADAQSKGKAATCAIRQRGTVRPRAAFEGCAHPDCARAECIEKLTARDQRLRRKPAGADRL